MNLVEDHHLARQAEETHEPVLGLKDAQQALVDSADAERREKRPFLGGEPGLGFHIALAPDVSWIELRNLTFFHLLHLRKKGVAMHELQVELPLVAPLSQVITQDPLEHRIPGRLGRHRDIHAARKTFTHRHVRRIERRFGLALAHRCFDNHEIRRSLL